jgi:hypothetical protein
MQAAGIGELVLLVAAFRRLDRRAVSPMGVSLHRRLTTYPQIYPQFCRIMWDATVSVRTSIPQNIIRKHGPSGHLRTALDGDLERAAGIEPASLAWKAKVLPLHNARAWAVDSPRNLPAQPRHLRGPPTRATLERSLGRGKVVARKHDRAFAEAQRRIAEAKRDGSAALDLIVPDLLAIPDDIAGLTALTSLDLSGTPISDFAPPSRASPP